MTESDIAPVVATSETAQPVPQKHLHAIDLMRVITIGGVIAVHAVSFTNHTDSIQAGAVVAFLHVNREVFVVLTSLVLAYSLSHTRGESSLRFWARRYWLVGIPYLVWTALYFLADGEPLWPLSHALGQIGHDLLTGVARYHLYFLLLTMQMYLVFPLLLLLIRATRGRHRELFGASLLLQITFTAMIHYQLPAPGPLAGWFAHPDALLPSYQLYVITGALMADHVKELTSWVRGHLHLVVIGVLAAAAAGVGSYLWEVDAGYLRPLQAGQVFQPAVTIESLAVVLGLYALGVLWADRLRPNWLARLIEDGSDVSFGIYLSHPLVLQALLTLATFTGLLDALVNAPIGVTLAIGLLGVVPLVFAITWVLVRLARGTRLSLPLTGRRMQPVVRGPRTGPSSPYRRWAVPAMGGVGIAMLVAVVAVTHLAVGRISTAGLTPTGVPNPIHTGAPSTMPLKPPPRVGATSIMQTVTIGGLQRSYRVIRPTYQEASALPVIVVLHGVSASIDLEEQRDSLLPLTISRQAILVYPVGYGESWNAGSCCGIAQDRGVDDVAFLSTIIRKVAASPGADPDSVYLVGFSNGGKMAYRLVCSEPRLVTAVAIVSALPSSACPSGPPISLLQVTSDADPALPLPQVQAQVGAWRARDGCTTTHATYTAGRLTTRRWASCRHGAGVELDTYRSTDHGWFYSSHGTPATADVIWAFFKSHRKPD